METGRRGELVAYLAIIAVNLLVLPRWFSPGQFAFGTRVVLVALSAGVIAFCAWKVSGILGVSPFTNRKHPRYAPYEVSNEQAEFGESGERSDDSPHARARRRRAEARRFGQAEEFREYDPYDEAPGEPDPPTEPDAPARPTDPRNTT